MKQTKHLCTLALSAALLLAACSKNDGPSSPNNGNTAKPLNNGLYVLNEGSGANATQLTYYDSLTRDTTTDIYSNVNGEDLGSTGNDIIAFGSKLYVVMNVSSNITVLDKRTAKLIGKITASDGNEWEPRYAVPYEGKLLVSAYDGTVSVIDTSSLSITNTIKVGADPEGLTVSGSTLYVANSGGLNFPNYDSTVSVVDLTALKETKKIKVGINPQKLVTDSKGNVYVLVWGVLDYTTGTAVIPSKIYKINASTQSVSDSSSAIAFADKMTIYNDMLYLDGGSNQPVITLNTNNIEGSFSNFVTDGTTLKIPYGIDVDETNGDVYVTDANDYSHPGTVYCFDKTGKLKYSFGTGVLPDNVVFLR